MSERPPADGAASATTATPQAPAARVISGKTLGLWFATMVAFVVVYRFLEPTPDAPPSPPSPFWVGVGNVFAAAGALAIVAGAALSAVFGLRPRGLLLTSGTRKTALKVGLWMLVLGAVAAALVGTRPSWDGAWFGGASGLLSAVGTLSLVFVALFVMLNRRAWLELRKKKRAYALLQDGHLDEAVALLEGLIAARPRSEAAIGLYDLAWAELRRANPTRALALADEALQLGAAVPFLQIHARAVRSMAQVMLGNLSEGERTLAECEALAAKAADPVHTPHFARLVVAIGRGDLDRAAQLASVLEQPAASRPSPHLGAVARLVSAWVAAARGGGAASAPAAPQFPRELDYLALLPGFGDFLRSHGLVTAADRT